jgi:hypothetical protein
VVGGWRVEQRSGFPLGLGRSHNAHLFLALFVTLPILLYLVLKVAHGTVRSRLGLVRGDDGHCLSSVD